MSIGPRLRSAREAKRLTAAIVAERLGISEAAVRHHENETKTPRADTLIQYSQIYGVSLDWVMRGIGKGPGAGGADSEVVDLADIADEDRPLARDLFERLRKKNLPGTKG